MILEKLRDRHERSGNAVQWNVGTDIIEIHVQFLVNAYMYSIRVTFLLQNATIAMVVDDVIYLFIDFILHLRF